MNYRHIYHAGSFNDIIKHLTLVSVLNHLNKKEKPFAVLDGFAGIGLYDIQSNEAGRTGESDTGIKKLYSSLEILSKGPELIKMFLKIIKNTGDENLYPGSPLVIQNMLRAQDLLIACELHPEDYQALKRVIFTATHNIDAYQALKAFLPFQEKRGLVFLDPPFEVKNEFDKLLKGLMLIKQHAANLCTMIWYPLKDFKSVKTFYEQCKLIGFSEILKIEFELTELIPARSHNLEKEENKFYLNKCGLLIVNPPHIKDELKDNIDYLIKHIYSGKAKCNISLL